MFPFLSLFLSQIPFNKGNFSFYIDQLVIDNLTNNSDHSIRKFKRSLDQIYYIILHQTSFNWKDTNSNWKNVNAHFVIQQSGTILILHDIDWRLRTGSNLGNEYGITIEFEGNFPSSNDRCYKPEKFGCDLNGLTKEQIIAGRRLLWNLKWSIPSLRECHAHIQWDKDKTNCCGPHIWKNIGEWSKLIGYDADGLNQKGGKDIPNEWKNDKYLII